MTPIDIDFSPRTFRRALARTPRAAWLGGGAGFALCIWVAITAIDLSTQHKAREIQLRQILEKQTERVMHKPIPKKISLTEGQAHAINNAIAQLNLPWRELFRVIETTTPPTIALLSLEPDAKKQQINILAEAKNSDDMLAYIENLKRDAFLNDAVLIRHEINQQDPNHPIRFQIQAQWM